MQSVFAPSQTEKILAGIARASVLLVKGLHFDQTLQELVQIMGMAADADRCYIFKNESVDGEMCMSQQAEWTAENVSVQLHNPKLQAVPYSIYPNLLELLQHNHAVSSMVSNAPQPFKGLMEEQDILSYLFIPIRVKKQLWGFIGYDACQFPRHWYDYERDALQSMANAIGFYLENQELKSALLVSNKRYHLAISGSKDGIWELDLENNESFLSDLWFETFGYKREDGAWTYDYWLNLVHPDDREHVDQSFQKFLERGHGTNDMEFRFLHGLGHYVWVQSRAAAEWDADGQPKRMAGSDSDITGRKIHEQILAENEKQYRNLVNNLREVVFEADAEGRFTFLNQSWELLTGFSVVESIGQAGLNFLDPLELEHVPQIRADIDRNPNEYHTYEMQYRHKRGHTIWTEVTLKRVIGPHGDTLGSTGTIIDLTAKRKAERELQLSEAQYRLISENITDIVTQHDVQGNVTFASPSMREVLGYNPTEIIGLSPLEYIHPDDRQHVLDNAFQKLLQGEKRISISYRIKHQKGHYIWVESLTRFIPDAKGVVKAIQASTRDITERKKAEEEVARAFEKEKELTELRSQFVMMASHEFRTPLATIRSSLDILRMYLAQTEEGLRSKADKHFVKMQKEIERVGDLMNEILLMGKLEAGKTTLQKHPVRLEQLIAELIDMHFAHQDDGRVPALQVYGSPATVYIDEQLISHCILNLLGNALKFSTNAPTPIVHLHFKRKTIRIEVQDFGIGFKQGDKKKLFEPFYRGTNVGKIPGSGLGLVVVREFIAMHGGKISCSSSPAKGTFFNIELSL